MIVMTYDTRDPAVVQRRAEEQIKRARREAAAAE
jgi:hypothetical protein